jgi:hypothetical protein
MTIIAFHPFFPQVQMFNAATTAISLTVLTVSEKKTKKNKKKV